MLAGKDWKDFQSCFLQSYLKNLKKKQKELSKKHHGPEQLQDPDTKSITEEEDDSDMASIAREFKNDSDNSDNNIFYSPFMKVILGYIIKISWNKFFKKFEKNLEKFEFFLN
jgi:hypothetical protein